MDPKIQCYIHKGSPIIPTLSRTKQIASIHNYLFKIHSNFVLPTTPRSS